MKDQFSDIVDVSFTARMEESLDSVGMGEQDWKELLEHFYKPFAENPERAEKDVERIKIPLRRQMSYVNSVVAIWSLKPADSVDS